MTDTIENAGFRTIREIKERNEEGGFYFFSPDTMRFFRSRVLSGVYGGGYFITSERCGFGSQGGARRFTVRMAKPNGDIDTVAHINKDGTATGGFQAFDTADKARRYAKNLGLVPWLKEKEVVGML